MAWLRDLDTTYDPATLTIVPVEWFEDVNANFLAIGGAASNNPGTGANSFVIAGSTNTIADATAGGFVAGGFNQDLQQTSTYGAAVGSVNSYVDDAPYSGLYSTHDSHILGAGSWVANAIVGGYGWLIDGVTSSAAFSVIVGGTGDNALDGIYRSQGAGIFSGRYGKISSTLGGESDYSVVAGGDDNEISDSLGAFIGGGTTGRITGSDYAAIVGGGGGDIVSGSDQSAIVGGASTNSITGASYAFVGGGLNIDITGDYSVGLGGSNNTISGIQAAQLGGISWTLSGLRSVSLGGNGTGITADQADTIYGLKMRLTALPTSSAGLANGTLWNNEGLTEVAGTTGWQSTLETAAQTWDISDAGSLITATTRDAALQELARGNYARASTSGTGVYAIPNQPYVERTMTGNSTFNPPTPTTNAMTILLRISGTYTVTWHASINWTDGVAPAYDSPSLYSLSTFDGGTSWWGSQVGYNMS